MNFLLDCSSKEGSCSSSVLFCLRLNPLLLVVCVRDLATETLMQATTAPVFKPWELLEVQDYLRLDLATLKAQPNVCKCTREE